MATTSAIGMTSSSCVSWVLPSSANIASSTCCMVPICLSHMPLKCDARGGLNSHLHPCSVANFPTFFSLNSDATSCSSVFAPTKLVPRSHLRSLPWPRKAKNLLSVQINALASMASSTTMWMALLLRHVNTRPHLLAFAAPPLVFRVCTIQGPKTSKPTLVKGGRPQFYQVGGLPCAEPGVVFLAFCKECRLQWSSSQYCDLQ